MNSTPATTGTPAAPAPTGGAAEPPSRDTRQSRSLTLLVLLVLYAGSGFAAAGLHWTQMTSDLMQVGLIMVGSLVWLELDAYQRRRPLRYWERIGIVLFPLLFVPIRLFRTRRWRALLSLALLLLYLILLGVAGELGHVVLGRSS